MKEQNMPDNDIDTSEIDRAREWGRAVGMAAAARLGLVAG